MVAGASCYDSDTHRFFIWGIDNTDKAGSWGLIAHWVRWSATEPFPEANQNCLSLNTTSSTACFWLRASLNSTNTSAVKEPSAWTLPRATSRRGQAAQPRQLHPDGTVFDQLNRMYVLHWLQAWERAHIMAIDATTWDILADNPLNQNLELEMSNVVADQRYSLSEAPNHAAQAPPSAWSAGEDQHDPRTAERHPNGPVQMRQQPCAMVTSRFPKGSGCGRFMDGAAKSPARPSVAEDVRTSGHANVLDLLLTACAVLSPAVALAQSATPTPVDSSWLWATRSLTLS